VGISLQQAAERCTESFPTFKEMVHSLRAGGVSEAPDNDIRFQCRSHLFEEFGKEVPEDWRPPEGPDSKLIQFIGTLAEYTFVVYTCIAMAAGVYGRMGLCTSFHFLGTERNREYVLRLKAVSYSTSQERFVRCIKGSSQIASRSANLNLIAQELALHMAAHDFEFKIAAAYTRYNSERCPRRFVATIRNATKGHFPVLVRR
jgi:hypothetical protein